MVVAVFAVPKALIKAANPFNEASAVEAAPRQAGPVAALEGSAVGQLTTRFHLHLNPAGGGIKLGTGDEQIA